MKIGEIIQRVQSAYSKGVQSDDTRLSSRHIYNKMLTSRSKLLSQESRKNQKISEWNYQTLPCVELVKAQPYECPCIPPMGCEILKTKYPLPRPISNLDNHILSSVTSIEGTIRYDEIEWLEKSKKNGNRYTANKPDYYIRNNHLYVTHPGGPRIIAITGVFDDPIEASQFPSYCGVEDESCIAYYDMQFPIDNDHIDTLIDMCVKELVILFSESQEDLTNDSKDSLPEQSK